MKTEKENVQQIIWINDIGLAVDPADPKVNPYAAIVHVRIPGPLFTNFHYWVDLSKDRVFRTHLNCTNGGEKQWWKNGLLEEDHQKNLLEVFAAVL